MDWYSDISEDAGGLENDINEKELFAGIQPWILCNRRYWILLVFLTMIWKTLGENKFAEKIHVLIFIFFFEICYLNCSIGRILGNV